MRSEWLAGCPSWLCAPLLDLWPQDRMLQLALQAALALSALTLLVMLQVLLLGELARRRAARRQQFNERWRPLFALCSLGESLPDPLPALPRRQRLWFLLQWNRTQLQLRGSARERMNRALELLRGRVRSKLIGLTCLRHLAEPAHWDAVQPLLFSRNASVSLASAYTLIAMQPARAMQLILPAAAARTDWALPRLAGLCQQAGEEAVTEPLLAALADPMIAGRERLIALLPHGAPRQVAPWARAQLDEGAAAEHQQVALRCLAELGDPRDRPRLLPALAHSDPDVRLHALQALGRQARGDDAELFLPLLADRNWGVRQAAADGLARLPGASPEDLQALLASVPDRYGQDALRRAIAEVHR